MWREINVMSHKYMVKHCRQDRTCILHLTDLISIWAEEISTAVVIQRCKVQNPLIEADDESLIQHIFSLLDGTKEGTSFKSNVNETHHILEVRTKLGGVPFHFTFRLKLMKPEVLYQEVTRPLSLLANQLLLRQNTLCDLLEAKDAEIAEYKMEGAQLKRRKLETELFKRAEFIGTSALSTDLITGSVAITQQDSLQKITSIRNGSDHPVKTEECSLPTETQAVPGGTQEVPMETQESKLIPLKEIKEESVLPTDSRNVKKRKQAYKPKLHL